MRKVLLGYNQKISTKTSLVVSSIGIVGLVVLGIWWSRELGTIASVGSSQLATVVAADLSSAADFSILAGSTVTNTGSSVIGADLGLSPGTSVTGFPPGTVSGTQHITDGAAADAQTDLTTAYTTAAGEGPASPIVADLAGQTLTPGVYNSASSIGLNGALTLDGGGDPNAVFVFQAGSTLITGSASSVNLINGAQACNVFWQVGSSATLGTNSTFKGSILALTDATLTTGANVEGRVLARNGAVTLDTNVVTVPTCVSAATLHVIKSVINVSGGSGAAVSSDFNIYVKNGSTNVTGSPAAGTSTPGTLYSLAAGTYTVSEDADPLYTQSFGGACDSNGDVTLGAGQNATCTIINTDAAPPEPVVSASTGGRGVSRRVVPLIGILKVPSPLSLPGGSGVVTYDYTVWNVGGHQALTDVGVTDDKCSHVNLISGDVDADGKLGIYEKWKYNCTTTIATTTTNTAVATGYSNDSYHDIAIATAIATVVVGAPVPPPLIDVVKVPNQLSPFPFGGGVVTYSYTVTNPGIVALHDVTVTDDKCAAVSFVSGDVNNNHLLEPSETWSYICTTSITVSTRNVATALGSANGFTAVDYAFATVLVSSPGLPNTGLPPYGVTVSGVPVTENAAGLRLRIPKINVDALVESAGLTSEGAVEAPHSLMNAAWFALGPVPGQTGTSVIDGHFGGRGGAPAVFDNLSELHAGDTFSVENALGVTTTFVVRSVHTYGKNESAPEVFASSDMGEHLNLITCNGIWDPIAKSYSHRLVIFADKE